MRIALLIITVIALTSGSWAAQAVPTPASNATTNGPTKQGTSKPEQVFSMGDWMSRGADLERAGQNESAFQIYQQAALAGDPEGAFRAGKLGWETAKAQTGKKKLLGLDAGIQYLYRAATNRHVGACLALSQSLREGRGVQPDLTQAYIWLLIAKHYDPTMPTAILDQWVGKLDAGNLRQAQQTARRWLAGAWPERVTPAIIQGDTRLRICGISQGANPTVLINRKTFMVGDSMPLAPLLEVPRGAKTNAPSLDVTCIAIDLDYVLVKVGAEANMRLLALDVN